MNHLATQEFQAVAESSPPEIYVVPKRPRLLQKGGMRWYFGFFFVSGFCSILYELIWLRLAMARFAVTTAFVSIVLSAFMIGLGFGSWAAGRLTQRSGRHSGFPALRLYALAELLIGTAAILVPRELAAGRWLVERLDVASTALPSAWFYLAAGAWIGLTLVPWCACMGATFPLAMSAIQRQFPAKSTRSFSYLYLANVLGALTGAALPLLLIEAWGFQATLRVGAVLNLCLALSAFALSFKHAAKHVETVRGADPLAGARKTPATVTWFHYLVFGTGFTSLGAEVVWIRLFTPALGTVVYAFATILGLYLAAMYVGTVFYRRGWCGADPRPFWLSLFAVSVTLPLLACDPRLPILYPLRALSILPFSCVVGYLTPMLVDRVSLGDPDRAGRLYAVNIAGCVLGPLASGFLLLPLLGERLTLLALGLPWILASCREYRTSAINDVRRKTRIPGTAVLGLVALAVVFGSRDFESQFSPREVRRDSTATVTAIGSGRTEKQLLVNGIGMSGLTPITKMIAHLPLAFLQRPPTNALVICFGMGTTHRSALSWGIHSTAVELVPSVIDVFPYFHSDASRLLASPFSRLVADDGRFFLERSSDQYDVIAIDPPPPVEAAGSSLLYSKEFYAIAKLHLRRGGILQQWFPTGSKDPAMLASVAKALKESFPYVRVFRSMEGWGHHFLASEVPLPSVSAAVLASRLPSAARADLLEWGPASDPEQQFAFVLDQELSVEALIARAPAVPALQDDRPVNEYFLLRRVRDGDYLRSMWLRLLAHLSRKP